MIGIDGCKYGWCVVHDSAEGLQVLIISNISELESVISKDELICIDIPIGLPDGSYPRRVEQIARKMLPSKSSSFFGVPCRDAVYAYDYKEANKINKVQLEKGLSIQSWHICSKIKEVDTWLLESEEANKKIKEAHPELCFYFLQKDNSPLLPKKTSEGRAQRLKIVSSWYDGLDELYDDAMSKYIRKDVAADDILDAMCLWCIAKLSQTYQLESITESQEDRMGLSMNMYFVDPYGKLTS